MKMIWQTMMAHSGHLLTLKSVSTKNIILKQMDMRAAVGASIAGPIETVPNFTDWPTLLGLSQIRCFPYP